MRKEALNLTDEIKKEIKSRLLKKDINREEIYQQFYQETADFVMKEFPPTTTPSSMTVSPPRMDAPE